MLMQICLLKSGALLREGLKLNLQNMRRGLSALGNEQHVSCDIRGICLFIHYSLSPVTFALNVVFMLFQDLLCVLLPFSLEEISINTSVSILSIVYCRLSSTQM